MNLRALQAILADGRVKLASGRTAWRDDHCPRPLHGKCGYLGLPTGIPEIDSVLPAGGLRGGATHDWFAPGLDLQDSSDGPWRPPLTVLARLAMGTGDGLIIWVGRACWPMPGVLGPAMSRSLFVCPDDDHSRFWAIDQALRSPGVGVVVADAARLDMAGSRRLQLAAEAGGALAMLARPARERGVISAAETRWMVRPELASPESHLPCWSLELLRCKGASLAIEGARWIVEWGWSEVGHETCSLRVPADVERGPREATPAPAERPLRIA